MKKLLLLVAWVFCINCGIVMASSPDIAVAVVHGQFAAELSCEDELMVRVPDTGEEMVLKPDRYFVNAEVVLSIWVRRSLAPKRYVLW